MTLHRFNRSAIKYRFLVGLISISVLGSSYSSAENTSDNEPQEKAPLTIADFIPEVPGLDLQAPIVNFNEIPDALKAIAERKVAEQQQAPGWVRTLQKKTLAHYFQDINEHSTKEQWLEARSLLLKDSTELFNYYESDNKNSEMYQHFIDRQLKKFIDSIDLKSLNAVYRNSQVAEPMSNWTVESLVVREQIVYTGHFPNAVKSVMNLVSGPHFKGATVIAGLLALTAAGIYTGETLYHFSPVATAMAAGSFIGNMFFTAFKSSTLAGPLNSLLDCIFGPTNEFVGIQASRYLGGVRRAVNNFYDKLKPKPQAPGEDAGRNQSPNYPDPIKDNMTFANMSREEQDENWDKCLRMWNGVQSTFGQLLRGNHHAGRSLMMIAWSDEQITKILIETLDSKLILYASQIESRLQIYKDIILSNQRLSEEEKMAQLGEFLDHFDLYQSLTDKKWLDLSFSDEDIKTLDLQINEHFAYVAKRLMKRDLDLLVQIQESRKDAVRSLFTGLTLNEIRSYMVAEANRNLDTEARIAQRAIRRGFQLQSYVEQYENHIQLVMQEMGFKNALKLRRSEIACKELFN